jgi:hypothetical protein
MQQWLTFIPMTGALLNLAAAITNLAAAIMNRRGAPATGAATTPHADHLPGRRRHPERGLTRLWFCA